MKNSAFKFSKPVIEKITYIKKDKCNTANLKGRSIPLQFTVDVDDDKEICEAMVKLILEIKEEDDFPFAYSFSMYSRVKWEKGLSDDMIDHILSQNVPAMILSYARPIISLITSYSEYKQFDIPFVDLRDFGKNPDKDEIE